MTTHKKVTKRQQILALRRAGLRDARSIAALVGTTMTYVYIVLWQEGLGPHDLRIRRALWQEGLGRDVAR